MKISVQIAISLALVWFGGAGLAFATCPQPMPACPCPHSHEASTCCCEGKAPQPGIPACSVNHAPPASCACYFSQADSSTTEASVYRTTNIAIILDSTTVSPGPASITADQSFPALPSVRTLFTPLRI